MADTFHPPSFFLGILFGSVVFGAIAAALTNYFTNRLWERKTTAYGNGDFNTDGSFYWIGHDRPRT